MHKSSGHLEDGTTNREPCRHLTNGQTQRPDVAQTIDDIAHEERNGTSTGERHTDSNEKTDTDGTTDRLSSMSVSWSC